MDKKQQQTLAQEECICKGCPSFQDCGENIGYCVMGGSACIKERRGCICGGCPVHKKLNLEGGYFCIE